MAEYAVFGENGIILRDFDSEDAAVRAMGSRFDLYVDEVCPDDEPASMCDWCRDDREAAAEADSKGLPPAETYDTAGQACLAGLGHIRETEKTKETTP